MDSDDELMMAQLIQEEAVAQESERIMIMCGLIACVPLSSLLNVEVHKRG